MRSGGRPPLSGDNDQPGQRTPGSGVTLWTVTSEGEEVTVRVVIGR